VRGSLEDVRTRLSVLDMRFSQRSLSRVLHITLAACFILVSWFAFSSTLKMEAIFCFETSIDFYRTTGHHITEDETLQDRSCFELLLSLTIISSSLREACVAIVLTDELGVTWNG
jgi:hypothetical protein